MERTSYEENNNIKDTPDDFIKVEEVTEVSDSVEEAVKEEVVNQVGSRKRDTDSLRLPKNNYHNTYERDLTGTLEGIVKEEKKANDRIVEDFIIVNHTSGIQSLVEEKPKEKMEEVPVNDVDAATPEQPKSDDNKQEEKKDEEKKEEKVEEKKEEEKKPEAKPEEQKKDEGKKEEGNKDEGNKDEANKGDEKKEEGKTEEGKADDKKAEGSPEEAKAGEGGSSPLSNENLM